MRRNDGLDTLGHMPPDEGSDSVDRDAPQAADLDRFGSDTVTCRTCGHEVYDEVDVCPRCGAGVMATPTGFPRWVVIVAAIVLLLAVGGWLLTP